MDRHRWDSGRTTRSQGRCHTILGWSCSLFVHSLVLAGAIALSGRVHLQPPAEPFRWDVALVRSAGGETPELQPQAKAGRASPAHLSPSSRSAMKSARSQTTTLPSTPAQDTMQAVAQLVHHIVQQRVETVTTNVAVRQGPSQAMVSKAVISQTTPITSASLQETTPAVDQSVQHAVQQRVQAATTNVIVRQESQQAIVSQAVLRETAEPISRFEQGAPGRPIQAPEGDPSHEGATSLRGHAVAGSIVSRVATASAPQQGSRALDYGWLAETLWKRVQALKRYPLKAAADRVTGQVLVAAVVQADGAIAEVRITESSGFPLLDEAAVEAVRNASPLALLRSLDHAQVSVEIPITYHGHN